MQVRGRGSAWLGPRTRFYITPTEQRRRALYESRRSGKPLRDGGCHGHGDHLVSLHTPLVGAALAAITHPEPLRLANLCRG